MPKTTKSSGTKGKRKVLNKDNSSEENTSPQIVAIGASAGGLEAIEKFLDNVPPKSSLSFAIIQHLDPNYKSIMDHLLGKHTKMPIKIIKDGMKIENSAVYLGPPDKYVIIINNVFQLIDFEESRLRYPIDYFFRSLSEDQNEKAIGIILSGTGTDGTLGIKSIKAAGGLIIAQDGKQAKYDGMPRSAIDTGLVDFILPVEKIPAEILNFLSHPYIKNDKIIDTDQQSHNHKQKVFALIRSKTGHDFTNYKQNTISRRIARRMAANQINNISDYVRYLQQNEKEVYALFKDLLITVTNFFRDPEAFKILEEKIILKIIKNKKADSSIRIWITACATGEEAYSLAMIADEILKKLNKHIKIQIFATDIDDTSIDTARNAVYPESIAMHVDARRLKRYFIKEENFYRIKKEIRDIIVFAPHNVIKDPPFSKLDLICCRNLLIYMDQELQKKLLPIFHFSLVENGVLFLGPSESIGEFNDLFSVIDSKWKLFKRITTNNDEKFNFAKINGSPNQNIYPNLDQNKNFPFKHNARELAQNLILENYSLPCVLIDENYDIQFFHGQTDKYLTPPSGEASFNILKMAREDIRYKLSTVIRKATKQSQTICGENLQLKYNGDFINFDLTVRPVFPSKDQKNMMLVVFDEKVVKNGKKEKVIKNKEDNQVSFLEQELQSTKEYLQTTIEELETSNEELKSTNEELQSTNEELQSTNEELETSKEELQSTNEELATINAEQENKVEELSSAKDDINNLLASTEIVTIFLDSQLNIKRFTPSAKKIFNLITTDLGRPISDITNTLRSFNINKYAKEVLETLVKKDEEINSEDGKSYSMKIMPYRTTENIIDGIVITFVDITEIKEAEKSKRLATVIKDSNDAVTLQDLNGKITAWNRGAEKIYGYSQSEALGMNVSQFIAENNKKEYLNFIKRISSGNDQNTFETQRISKEGKILDISITVTKITDSSNNITGMATTERDISMYINMKTEYEKKISGLEKEIKALKKK